IITTLADGAYSVYASDLDGDGDMDVLSGSYGDDKIAWYENTDGTGTFGTQQTITLLTDGAWSVYAADLDRDEDMDVLSASWMDDKIAWYENTDGAGTFGARYTITTQADGAWSVYTADLDGDGDMDVLSASQYDDKIAWYENTDGAGNFGSQQIITTLADEANSVYAADLDEDGDMDVLSASHGDSKIAWYENTDGAGTFGSQQIITIQAFQPYSVHAADLDGDGDMDVLSASELDNKIAWYENTDGAGTFGTQNTITTQTDGAWSVYAVDLDGDGDMDVLSASRNDDKIAWYENTDGAGNFGIQKTITIIADRAWSVYATDLDGDGDMDVLSASVFDDKIAWYENIALSSETNFLSFSFPEQTSSAEIDTVNHTIDIEVTYNADVSGLVATFTLSTGASAEVSTVSQISGTTSNDFSSTFIYTITAEDGITTQEWTVNVTKAIVPNAETDFTVFSFAEQTRPADIDNVNHTIDIEVNYDTDITSLVATFTMSPGASASISGTTQISGTTSNDFTNSVTYTITAEDGTTIQDWIVSVTKAPAPSIETDFTAFSFIEQNSVAVIDTTNHTINIEVIYSADTTNLVASFTLSIGASADIGGTVQVSGVTYNDFSSPLVYTVTAEDDTTTQNWTVTVTKVSAPNTETDFTAFSFAEQTGPADIDNVNHTIDIEVTYNTDVTGLVATFTLSAGTSTDIEDTPQVSGTTDNDFTTAVTYTVTAEDGTTTQDWIVTVTKATALSTETDFTAFSFAEETGPADIDAVNHTIDIEVTYNTDVTGLVAAFTLSNGASADIEGTPQISGTTANDFTNPVIYTITAEDGVTTQDWTITVTKPPDVEKPVLTYTNNPDEFPSESTGITAIVTVTDNRGVDEVLFYYCKYQDHEWPNTSTTKNGNEYSVSINSGMVGVHGMNYYFHATDINSNFDSTRVTSINVSYTNEKSPAIPGLQFGATVDKYQIISIPFELENKSITSVFNELGDYNIKYWRLYHYTGGETKEYSKGFTTIDPGQGYWLIARESTTIKIGSGKSVTLDPDGTFHLALESGWNQIGNPFNFNISWNNVRSARGNSNIGQVKLFNSGTLSPGDIIGKFTGGFVYLDGNQPETVKINPSTAYSSGRVSIMDDPDLYVSNSIDQDNWFVPFIISDGLITNELSGFGMHSEAKIGKDHFDDHVMPIPKSLCTYELVFQHPDEDIQTFCRNIVPSSEQFIWELKVSNSGESKLLTLYWDNRSFGDNTKSLMLADESEGLLYDMRESNSYSFTLSDQKTFKIYYDDLDKIENSMFPEQVTLGNGYPNPFDDNITIPFAIPENQIGYRVEIEILSLNGNSVVKLFSKEMFGGYYTIDWQVNQQILHVNSGLYLVKMEVVSETDHTVITRKILRK
ncbi:FG-GAP-like repeat-containing protein, partial [Bacteroidota bacterium]